MHIIAQDQGMKMKCGQKMESWNENELICHRNEIKIFKRKRRGKKIESKADHLRSFSLKNKTMRCYNSTSIKQHISL